MRALAIQSWPSPRRVKTVSPTLLCHARYDLRVAADFGAGDERIRIADGAASSRDAGVWSEGSEIAAAQARAQCGQDILRDLAVVCGSAGHSDRFEAVEFVTDVLGLGPGKERLERHARFAQGDVHAGRIARCGHPRERGEGKLRVD